MKPKFIGVTNALTDILISVTDQELDEMNLSKASHNPSSKVNLSKFYEIINKKESKRFLGGTATNTIRGINNLGFQTYLVGAVGEDEIGKEFITKLCTEGIEPYFIKIPNRESGKCFVLITPDKERSFVVSPGVYANYPDLNFKELPKLDWFYSSGYELISHPERMLNFVKSFKKIKTKIGFDLGSEIMIPYCPELFKEVVSYTDVLFANEKEMETYQKLGGKIINDKVFVLKKGKKGSTIYNDGKKTDIPSVKINNLVNTNGAGDSYAAGFLFAYEQGQSLRDCGNFASNIASKVCSQEEAWYKGN